MCIRDSYTAYKYLKEHGIHHIDYLQPLSDETTEYQNLAKLNEQFQTKNLILPNGQYFAGDLEKSLEEVEKISYYEKSAKTILNDDVTIELYSEMWIRDRLCTAPFTSSCCTSWTLIGNTGYFPCQSG